jgi:hypothetical protein
MTPASVVELLDSAARSGQADQLTGLVIGAWFGDESDADSSAIVETLVAAADQLPSLRALFFSDVTSEENEISWIYQSTFRHCGTLFPDWKFWSSAAVTASAWAS